MPGEIRAKLTDFGHCVFMYQNRDSSDLEENKKFEAPLGTPEWNALELRSNTSIFDSQTIYLTANEMILTDIYSFGLVYWSILLNGADGFDCIPEVQQAGVGKDFRKKKTNQFRSIWTETSLCIGLADLWDYLGLGQEPTKMRF